MRKDFAIFICTHGRPDRQHTFNTLMSVGYTGEIIFVVDDEDNSVSELRRLYPKNKIMTFCKQDFIEESPTVSLIPNRKTILYAKNACEFFAKQLDLSSFVIADDDIVNFRYRYIENGSVKSFNAISNFDAIIETCCQFMLTSNLAAFGFGIAQYYFAGTSCMLDDLWKWRVPYNFVFRNTSKPILWQSDYGEDLITSITYANQGEYMLCCPMIQQTIKPLGKMDDGMAEVYRTISSFKLAQYGFIYHPTAEIPRYYKDHWMSWIKRENAFPKLVSDTYRKEK